ncbi:DUF945 family protein [Marinagarivorans algicola]|uniref:DUF945 family protein n=1 Tax=Marinagarivorans algicola TaxID=1513270 RepID=UPI0006B9FEB3|nr:DUF945 family protein [Marinagarivorans algicola]
MKKIISFLLFVILPLLLVVPGFMGWQAEKSMQDTAAYINSLPAYSANWQSYKRGWFKSEGVLLVSVDDIEGLTDSTEPVELPVAFHLVHGPVLLGHKTEAFTLGLGGFDLQVTLLDRHEAYLQDVLSVIGEGPLYQLAARMDLTGRIALHDRWLPFEFNTEALSIVADGYEGEGEIGLDRKLIYTMGLPRIRIKAMSLEGSAVAFTAKALKAELSAELASWHSAQVAPGKVIVSVGSLKNETASIVFKDMHFEAEAKIDAINNTLSYLSELNVGALNIAALEADMSDIQLELSYLKFSLAFLESYYALIQDPPANANAEYWQQYLGELILKELLPASPELKIDTLAFTTSQGKFFARLLLTIEGESLAKANVSSNNPLGLLPFMVFHLDTEMDMALAVQFAELYVRNQIETQWAKEERVFVASELNEAVKTQVPSVLDMLISQGFIVSHDDDYRLNIDYAKGQATLNGQPMPLPF